MLLGCQGQLAGHTPERDPNPDPPGSPGSNDPGTGLTGDPAALCEQSGNALQVGRTRLRRLTRSELDHTLRDLVGAAGTPSERLSPDERIGPFYSNAIAPVDELLVQQHAEVAAAVAAEAEARMAALSPCDLAADTGSTCAAEFITDFGRRAYRRPLTATERDRYLALYELERAQGSASSAFRTVLGTMLESPNFLYHVEVGGQGTPSATPVPLGSYEIAARLSYFLWNSMPDARLFDLAAAGTLGDDGVLDAEVERMLTDPRAGDAVPSFHLQWLGIGDLLGIDRDPARFPSFDADLASAMREETAAFSDFVVRQGDGLLKTLFTASFSFPRRGVFAVYGLAEPAGFTPGTEIALDPNQRAGLLTQPAFLTKFSHRDQTSPVHRGIAVRENILCQPLNPPPADVNNVAPAVSAGTTTRARLEAHVAEPRCAGCHTLIDPIGLGFEHYDSIGAYRGDDGGLPIDASGEILGVGDAAGSFVGAVELSHKLAQSTDVANCVASQWFRFALGRMESNDDACSVQRIREGFAASGGNVRALLREIVKSDAFRYVRATGQ